MYPQPDLILLSQRKRALMHRIRMRRTVCATHLQEVVKPAVWVEGVYMKWQSISPFTKLAAVPLGLMVTKRLLPKLGGWLGWAPMAINLFRALR